MEEKDTNTEEKNEIVNEEKKSENSKEKNEKPQNNEKLSKDAINNLFGEEYFKILSTLKDMESETKKYFVNINNKLDEKYKEFNINKENNFASLNKEISNNNKNEIDKEKSEKYLEQLVQIKNLHEQILESIKLEMSILINSFDVSKSLDEKKLIPKFLEKEFNRIINSWLFINLDFGNFNFIKTINNSGLDKDFKDFLYKVCQNKNFVMNIEPTKKNNKNLNNFVFEEIQDQDLKMISENYKNLTKMKINRMKNVDTPFKLINELPKLRYLKFYNCLFSGQEEKYSLIGKCNSLEKLIFNGVYNFEMKMLENLSKNITKLVLSNNNFINSDFNNIMKNYIINSSSLKSNLEFLSFSNNNLTNIDLANLVCSSKNKFKSLKELDFHKNRITDFTISTENFLELNCINCCYNNFSKLQFDINGKIISLLSGNIFLTDLKKCQYYYDILGKKLKDDNIFFTHLTISYLPFEYGKNYFENIIIKNNTAKNLKKLDLSYNNLTCDVLFKFFQNNVNFFSLKDLNLSGNQLDDIFFEKFLEYNYHSIFKKLEKINLKGNLIGNESIIKFDNLGEEPKNDKNRTLDIYKFRLIYKFIEKNKNLSKLYLTENPISEKLMIVTKSEEIAIEKDEQNNIIIDSFYSLLVKIKEELSMNKEEKINRGQFIIKFDIDRYINLDSESFDYKKKLIKFK